MEVVILFGMVIGLLLLGVPIAISLGLSSIVFLLLYSDASMGSIAQTLFSAFDGHYTLLAIPFFILLYQAQARQLLLLLVPLSSLQCARLAIRKNLPQALSVMRAHLASLSRLPL